MPVDTLFCKFHSQLTKYLALIALKYSIFYQMKWRPASSFLSAPSFFIQNVCLILRSIAAYSVTVSGRVAIVSSFIIILSVSV